MRVDGEGLGGVAGRVEGLVRGFGSRSLSVPPEAGHPGLNAVLGDVAHRFSVALDSRLSDVSGLAVRLREAAADMGGTEETAGSELRRLGHGLR